MPSTMAPSAMLAYGLIILAGAGHSTAGLLHARQSEVGFFSLDQAGSAAAAFIYLPTYLPTYLQAHHHLLTR